MSSRAKNDNTRYKIITTDCKITQNEIGKQPKECVMSTSQLSLETRVYSLPEGSMRYRILGAHSSGWKPVHVYVRPLCTGWRCVSVSVFTMELFLHIGVHTLK